MKIKGVSNKIAARIPGDSELDSALRLPTRFFAPRQRTLYWLILSDVVRSTAVFVFRDRGFGWGDMGRGFFIRFFSAISALLRLGRSPVDRW